MKNRTDELVLPAYISLPDGDDPEGFLVLLNNATVGQLQACVDTRAARIAGDQGDLFPLRTLLSVRRTAGAQDADPAILPGSFSALHAALKNDFTDAEYERLNALLDADPRVVDLVIHITRGVAISDAAAQMIRQGQREIAQGDALVELAGHRSH